MMFNNTLMMDARARRDQMLREAEDFRLNHSTKNSPRRAAALRRLAGRLLMSAVSR